MATKKPASTIQAAIRSVRGELDAANAEVSRLHERRRKAERAPQPRDQAKAAITARINTAARAGEQRIAAEAGQFGRSNREAWDPREIFSRWVPAQESFKPDSDVFLALCGGDLEHKLHAAVDADPAFDYALTEAERQKRLAELDQQIADATQRRDALEAELRDAGLLGSDEDAAEHVGGDRGMLAFREQHERERQAKNAELERADIAKRREPRVLRAFAPERRITVGADT